MSTHDTEWLSAFLDGELALPERRAVEAHLLTCPECQAWLRALRVVNDAAGNMPVEAPDGYFEDLPARVRARIEKDRPARPDGRRSGWRWPTWAWAAAAALVLAVVVPRTIDRVPPGPAPESVAPSASAPNAAPESEAEPSAPLPPVSTAPAVTEDAAARDQKARAAPSARQEGKESRPAVAAPAPAPQRPAPPTAGASSAAPGTDALARRRVLGAPPSGPAEADLGAAKAEADSPVTESSEAGAPAEPPGPLSAALETAAAAAPSSETTFRSLLRTPPSDADGWRGRREGWRVYAEEHSGGPHADEARVRVIEAGVAAWRAGGRDDDLERALADLAAYLGRDDARQKDRARRAVESLEER